MSEWCTRTCTHTHTLSARSWAWAWSCCQTKHRAVAGGDAAETETRAAAAHDLKNYDVPFPRRAKPAAHHLRPCNKEAKNVSVVVCVCVCVVCVCVGVQCGRGWHAQFPNSVSFMRGVFVLLRLCLFGSLTATLPSSNTHTHARIHARTRTCASSDSQSSESGTNLMTLVSGRRQPPRACRRHRQQQRLRRRQAMGMRPPPCRMHTSGSGTSSSHHQRQTWFRCVCVCVCVRLFAVECDESDGVIYISHRAGVLL